MSELRGTSRSQWKQKLEKLVLPSGNEIVCKKPDLVSLVMSSNNDVIPDMLFNQVSASLEGRAASEDEKEKMTRQDYSKVGGFMELIIRAAAVHPRIASNLTLPEADDEILYDQLDGADRQFIFKWAMPSEVTAASKFSEKPAVSGLDISSNLQAVQSEPRH